MLMLRILLAVFFSCLLAGCGATLPFTYEVSSIIPEAMKVKGAYAKGYALNDSGVAVGIYSAPGRYGQVFMFSKGAISLYSNPCDGYFHIRALTNSGRIGGTCYAHRNDRQPMVLVLRIVDGQLVRDDAAMWPMDGYMLLAMNDRGDVVVKSQLPYHLNPRRILGFLYVDGLLQEIVETDDPSQHAFVYSALNNSGMVAGGRFGFTPVGNVLQKAYPSIFKDGEFSVLRMEGNGAVVGINNLGHLLFKLDGPKFGVLSDAYREIGCGKEWCSPKQINDSGWVLGYGSDSYSVPPAGISIKRTFLWINGRLFNLDKSVRKSIRSDDPVALGNSGHILFHADGWPYLLTPTDLVSGDNSPSRIH